MLKINLTGDNMATIKRRMEDAILHASAPETIEFQVEYISTARLIAGYAIMHGYKAAAHQDGDYKFFVTMEVDRVREHTLVDEVVAGIEPENQPYNPEYAGLI